MLFLGTYQLSHFAFYDQNLLVQPMKSQQVSPAYVYTYVYEGIV